MDLLLSKEGQLVQRLEIEIKSHIVDPVSPFQRVEKLLNKYLPLQAAQEL